MNRSGAALRSFIVEAYLPVGQHAAAESTACRLRDAAAALRAAGVAVAFESGLLLAGDELVLFLFRSETRGAVEQALAGASVRFDRIAESIAVGVTAPDSRGGRAGLPPAQRRRRSPAITTRGAPIRR